MSTRVSGAGARGGDGRGGGGRVEGVVRVNGKGWGAGGRDEGARSVPCSTRGARSASGVCVSGSGGGRSCAANVGAPGFGSEANTSRLPQASPWASGGGGGINCVGALGSMSSSPSSITIGYDGGGGAVGLTVDIAEGASDSDVGSGDGDETTSPDGGGAEGGGGGASKNSRRIWLAVIDV